MVVGEGALSAARAQAVEHEVLQTQEECPLPGRCLSPGSRYRRTGAAREIQEGCLLSSFSTFYRRAVNTHGMVVLRAPNVHANAFCLFYVSKAQMHHKACWRDGEMKKPYGGAM